MCVCVCVYLYNEIVQFSSVAQSCPNLCDPMNRSTPGLPVHHQLPEFTSIKSVLPSSHLILCCPLFLLPPIPPSIRVFSSESTLRMRWPKYWSFSFSIIPSKEHPGLISFRMDWLDLLAVHRANILLQTFKRSKNYKNFESLFYMNEINIVSQLPLNKNYIYIVYYIDIWHGWYAAVHEVAESDTTG